MPSSSRGGDLGWISRDGDSVPPPFCTVARLNLRQMIFGWLEKSSRCPMRMPGHAKDLSKSEGCSLAVLKHTAHNITWTTEGSLSIERNCLRRSPRADLTLGRTGQRQDRGKTRSQTRYGVAYSPREPCPIYSTHLLSQHPYLLATSWPF